MEIEKQPGKSMENIKMNLLSLAVNDIAFENGSRHLNLQFDFNGSAIGKGTMTWNLDVASFTFDKKGKRFAGMARRKPEAEMNLEYSEFSIRIGDDGLLVVDKDGARIFHFATTLAKETFSSFLHTILGQYCKEV